MSVQYEALKCLAKMIGLKRMWGGSVDELLAKKRKQNARNHIPELHDPEIQIPAQYMKDAEIVMRHGDDSVPEYMIRLQKGDFTNCPRVTFIYGSDETLYAVAPSFERAMQRYGVDYRMIVGRGMFHCYPVFPIVPEAKEGWRQMVELMKA